MEEVKIRVDNHGTLVAVYPDGRVGPIWVYLPDAGYYGVLIAGTPLIYEAKEDVEG